MEKKCKIFLIMKLSTILMVVFTLNLPAVGLSQFSFTSEGKKIREVFDIIEKQSNYRFFYNDDFESFDNVTNLNVENQNINQVLDKLFESSDFTYKVFENNLIVVSLKESIQQNIIKGQVLDEKGNPLPGVNVQVQGTTIGSITDSNGRYSIEKPNDNAVLVFSFIGYNAQNISVSGKTTVDIVMNPNVQQLEEVVVVGYGTQRRLEVTSAVATVRTDNFVKGSVKDAAQLIQGKVAGLIIGTPSGDPNAQSQILLRGTATLMTSTQPLVLVDGIPGDLNTVPPEEIESIDVLKDGSSAAIYGTRGTNGVILISTKRANGNIQPTIDFNSYMSTQSFVNIPKMLTAAQMRARIAEGSSFQDYGSSTDWVKEISKNNPLSYNANLTFSGGNTKTNYLATVGYRDQDGLFLNSESRTFNTRFDVNHNMFNDKLKININYINSNNKSGVGFNTNMYRQATRYNPTAPKKNDDGTWFENSTITENINPLAWLEEMYGDNQYRSYRVSGSVTWLPVTDLSFKMVAAANQDDWMGSEGYTKNHYTTTQDGQNGEAYKSFGQNAGNLLELSASYNKKINSHNLSLMAGYSWQHNTYERGSMYNFDFPAGNFSYIDNIGAGNALSLGLATMESYKEASNLIGFFGRLTYNYKEKYLLMVNIRYEGSSRFVGTEEPWGTFPAISVGWRISEEDFMKSLSFVDNLKLRVGYGVTGTAPDELFLGVSRLGYGERFYIDGKWVPGLTPINNPNPHLKWERKTETNLGVDFGMFKGKLNGSIDLYSRRTDGLLYDYEVPSPPNLYTTTKANVGVMDNKGIELLLSSNVIQKQKFYWNTSVTYSTNRNKLISLDNDLYKATNPWFNAGDQPTPINTYSHRVEVGKPIGNFWGYKVIDITEDGYWIYEDKNGNPAETVNEEDKKVIGNGLPKSYLSWNNSLRYGNFDLDISMRGAFGFQIENVQRMLFEVPGFTSYNQLVSAYDKVFGKTVLNKNVYPDWNSYYVEDGDYWKIDNVTLGYNFTVSGTKHIKSMRLYVSTLNTLVLTKYKGMDPEVNQLGLTPGYDANDKYPSTRTYTFGLKVSFK
jgi:TonB-dependent starch-binding outer membrane protein SusC